jgi:hypothetical protein
MEDALPLEEGRVLPAPNRRLRVLTDEDEDLGIVFVECWRPGAKKRRTYVVRGPAGEVLLPAVENVILRVDLNAREHAGARAGGAALAAAVMALRGKVATEGALHGRPTLLAGLQLIPHIGAGARARPALTLKPWRPPGARMRPTCARS